MLQINFDPNDYEFNFKQYVVVKLLGTQGDDAERLSVRSIKFLGNSYPKIPEFDHINVVWVIYIYTFVATTKIFCIKMFTTPSNIGKLQFLRLLL